VATATAAVVARQEAVGIDVAGDGEQGRESFLTYVRDRLDGFGGIGDLRRNQDFEDFPEYAARRRAALGDPAVVSLARVPAAVSDIRWLGPEAVTGELGRLRRAAEGRRFEDLFVTAPSPGIVAAAMTNRHYPSLESYVDAVADALAGEYRAVLDAGLLLQIDAPDLALERHVTFRLRPLADFVAFAEHVVAAIGRALAGAPPERVRLHVCWGNYDGPHNRDVPLAEMLPTYLRVPAGTLVLSMANPRHAHEHRVLRDLPPDRRLVVGCIDTTTNYVEHPQVVADRLVQAVEAVGDPGRVQAGTDCGFGTAAGPRDVAPDVAWAKLGSLVEGSRLAAGMLGL
jgi:5-methyltetrahydropteroyltriglutamate--homocysteine methyltransferase